MLRTRQVQDRPRSRPLQSSLEQMVRQSWTTALWPYALLSIQDRTCNTQHPSTTYIGFEVVSGRHSLLHVKPTCSIHFQIANVPRHRQPSVKYLVIHHAYISRCTVRPSTFVTFTMSGSCPIYVRCVTHLSLYGSTLRCCPLKLHLLCRTVVIYDTLA